MGRAAVRAPTGCSRVTGMICDPLVATTKRTTKKAVGARSTAGTTTKKVTADAGAKVASSSGSRARAVRASSRRAKGRSASAVAPARETRSPEEPVHAAPAPEPAVETVIVTAPPEPALAARVPLPEPAPPRPSGRRGIFFDVENTSRASDVERVLAHLDVDRAQHVTDFFAVGNWRVIGHDTARLLARHGAALVHSAPSVGVRDWSDLRIAVTAGVWLAGARPGDLIEIVSDDQAFDAVGDVAASLGVLFRRTSYRALAGLAEAGPAEEAAEPRRRPRRGGRGRHGERDRAERRGQERERPHHRGERPVAVPSGKESASPPGEPPHTAPHDEIVQVVRDLLRVSPGGVSLDVLANALRNRGFSRPPGSPRLITRLRRIRELEVARNGLIRLVEPQGPASGAASAAPVAQPPGGEGAETRPAADASDAEWEAWAREAEERDAARRAAEQETRGSETIGPAQSEAAEPSGESAAEDLADGNGGRRRRGRRGGRRRRSRRSAAALAPPVPAVEGA